MGYYLTACICLNGHVVSDRVETGGGTQFCSECGEATITSCPSCNTNIRGDYEADGVFFIGGHAPTAKPYCLACGKPYPWTERKLDGITELSQAVAELTDHERGLLAELMPHLIQETPRTPVAVLKVAAILKRALGPAQKVLSEAIVSMAADAGKKALGLG